MSQKEDPAMMATVSAQTGAETTTGPIFESMADLSVEQLRARVSGDMPFFRRFSAWLDPC